MTHPLLREANFIGGQWIAASASTATTAVDNPATGEIIGHVPALGAAETENAVKAAAAAQPSWAALTAGERAKVLRRLSSLITERREDLANLLTLEQGKPLAEARAEIQQGADFFLWFAEEARRAYGDVIPAHQADKRLIVFKQAVGVVGAITPWNFPHSMIARKLAPALAAGCAMVLKPAEQTPFSAIALAVLAEEAGVPAGVFNVITGKAAEIGKVLTSDERVAKISFTGSTEVGAILYAQSAPTIKKLSLELGGNAPFLVFDDADLDAAVKGCIQSKYRNAGQTCVCANRIYVQSGVYDAFAAKLAAAVRDLKVGNGFEAGVDLGPLIDRAAIDKVERHIADATSKGASVALGGHPIRGLFFEPTILTGVTEDMLITHEETFGPVAPLVRFESEADGIRLANASRFGLAAYFYAQNLSRVWRVSEALESGMVGVNTGIISTEVAPFGGVKASGLGREGSKYGLDDYLEIKYVCMGV